MTKYSNYSIYQLKNSHKQTRNLFFKSKADETKFLKTFTYKTY